MPKDNPQQSARPRDTVFTFRLREPFYFFFLSGQTERKTETETVLALALKIEHQIHPSFLHSLPLSFPFKRLEVHPNWVLNAN